MAAAGRSRHWGSKWGSRTDRNSPFGADSASVLVATGCLIGRADVMVSWGGAAAPRGLIGCGAQHRASATIRWDAAAAAARDRCSGSSGASPSRAHGWLPDRRRQCRNDAPNPNHLPALRPGRLMALHTCAVWGCPATIRGWQQSRSTGFRPVPFGGRASAACRPVKLRQAMGRTRAVSRGILANFFF